ncbi:hypothetical protein [Candidiatus Paracoxiella cheracis]|uniref:hypothetical protein n=1 Tax=Candidiatus Paracoxiella cheracis TaxID=3405120 RepID=UPI003BF4EF02
MKRVKIPSMKAYKKLESIFEKLAYFEHLGAITNWDEAVMMPSGGGTIRAKALAALRNLTHETLTNPEVGELIEKAKDESLSSPKCVAMLVIDYWHPCQ